MPAVVVHVCLLLDPISKLRRVGCATGYFLTISGQVFSQQPTRKAELSQRMSAPFG